MAEQSWTDDPITAGQNRIRKKPIHFTELQDAINLWEAAYSIELTTWTDSPAVRVKIKSSAIIEMQEALDDLLSLATAAASGNFLWTEEPSSGIPIKPVHVNELRTNMNIMQDDYCYNCDSCDTDICPCDNSCDADYCDQCDLSCYGYVACTCNQLCYSGCYSDKYPSCGCNATCYGYVACTCNSDCNIDGCDLCDSSVDVASCAHCDNAIYRYPWT